MARGHRRYVTTIRVSSVKDFAILGKRWRELEQRADCSFFQSWSWTGCLAAERFPDPVLVAAMEGDRTVALALFNRVRRGLGRTCLYLGETGDVALDCPYIEDNGVLTEAGREAELTEACTSAVAASRVVILSGLDERALQAVRRAAAVVCLTKQNDSPFVDLVALRQAGTDYLAGRSANTRQQIRRSDRSYGAEELTVRRAESLAAAHGMLDAMAALHQTSWTARGQPGSFASPFFGRFHHALIEAAFPLGRIALTSISHADTVIGILYNFSFRGRILAYQSGFDYAAAGRQGKPGLTCHYAAISDALGQGHEVYDFLAGGDRYKRSLSNGCSQRYWVEAGPLWSPRLLSHRMRSLVRR